MSQNYSLSSYSCFTLWFKRVQAVDSGDFHKNGIRCEK